MSLKCVLFLALFFAGESGFTLKPNLKEIPPAANLLESKNPTWLKATVFATTAVLVPVMAILGAFAANPQWSIVSDIPGAKSQIAYIDHTMSYYTIPLSALFALIGSAPLWTLILRENLS